VGAVGGEPIAVATVASKPQLDGVLVEWGAPERIAVVAGGDRVGVRGAFTSDEDHEADVYLMWDADYIYVAVAVVDDIIDVARIEPGKNEWKGPLGQRKDKMFYYDHLKIFLRGPERPLGHNLWLSPAEGTPYFWGGSQRGKASERVPVEVGGAMRDHLYTYEVAIPWAWLNLYPQPDMVLDALFLLPDSDLPGQEIRKKVKEGNKWVWWQGKVQLKGRPPGLKERPKEQVVEEEIAKMAREITVPKVKVAPAVPEAVAKQEVPAAADQASVAAGAAASVAMGGSAGTAVAVEVLTGAENAQSSSISTITSQLNRRLLAREAEASAAPAWAQALNNDRDISSAQVDSLYYRLIFTLKRLTAENINARTDGLVMDIAEYAGVWRAQAQGFLQVLLTDAIADLLNEEGRLRPQISAAAIAAGVDGDKALRMVQTLCRQTLKIYVDGKVSLSETLLDKARRRAKLSEDETRALLVELARER
jgi:hypothetical protein